MYLLQHSDHQWMNFCLRPASLVSAIQGLIINLRRSQDPSKWPGKDRRPLKTISEEIQKQNPPLRSAGIVPEHCSQGQRKTSSALLE